ncbi:hypothetical protein [Pedobacter endophyticus]|uniref:Transglutaminase-like superfamily protein n=1 Tax=Pedobacter endophyticus TaxID=2789740 RepID=A0A7S9PYC5_9SPHI|nr:hypothetical protein [Pedobacter endophyticus]QPH39168.1 hypothetical protein IZT61_19265 [Pedobacter endophyticus]
MLMCIFTKAQRYSFDFYDGTFNFEVDSTFLIHVPNEATDLGVAKFYREISVSDGDQLVENLKTYRKEHELNDWIYYQLIRKTAQQISPKAENYFRYTLYKWFLLSKCGYDAKIAVGNKQIIFYVRNEEDISDIPFFMIDGHKYTCLNYHDYGKLFQQADTYKPINLAFAEAKNSFTYQVTRLPDFKPESYEEKDLSFSYKQNTYHFKLKINEDVEAIFKNYPGVNFESYFNIPLSRETYSSLIPVLKQNLKGMDQKKGVDYLMRFTRYAFLYENDDENFGKEKRLSPEQTLINKYSDCDDRAALFFYLVKEIYDLPMVALLYPTHLTMAVQFDKPVGDFVTYKGRKYSFCEPTPQPQDLKIGQVATKLKNMRFEVVYAYEPGN